MIVKEAFHVQIWNLQLICDPAITLGRKCKLELCSTICHKVLTLGVDRR